MFNNIRTLVVQKLIHLNENIIFYPKLKKVYQDVLVKDDLLILDVGCNKGQSLDFFLNINPEIRFYAFEPNPSLYKKLVQKYNKRSDQIEFHNKGVSKETGELVFYENILDETSSFEPLNYESKYLKKKAKVLGVKPENIVHKSYKVPTIKLADFMKLNNVTHVDVLKIDVEGHELACLQGLFDNKSNKIKIDYIQLESHQDDMYLNNNQAEAIHSIIIQNGYGLHEKVKHGFGDFFELIYKYQA